MWGLGLICGLAQRASIFLLCEYIVRKVFSNQQSRLGRGLCTIEPYKTLSIEKVSKIAWQTSQQIKAAENSSTLDPLPIDESFLFSIPLLFMILFYN
jgi:hypothetical protein